MLVVLCNVTQDGLAICRHVAKHGAQQWDLLQNDLQFPGVLAPLRWQVVRAAHNGHGTKAANTRYSEWELCVMLLVSKMLWYICAVGCRAQLQA